MSTTPRRARFGLAHLVGGKLWGGDSMMYYTGTYSVENGRLTIRVKAYQHSDPPGVESIFGRTQNTIRLEGPCTDTTAELEGRSDQASGIPIQVKMTWLTE